MFALLLLALWTEDRGRTRFAIDFQHFTYALTALVVTMVLFRGWLWLAEDLHVRFPNVPELAFVLAFPAGAATMYTRVVAGFQSALGFAFVLAIFSGLMWRLDLLLAIYVFIIGLVGSHFVVRCNRRQCVARAALLTGLVVAPVAACLALLDDLAMGEVAWVVAGGVAGAVLSGLTMLAVSPVLESLFGHITRIRLVELMNYQHPLLRRLTEHTPGTFQHSVTVGILSDAAARAIDADALLVRVASLYHDVGKLVQPEYFVENQHSVNPHDGLDPAESARIIINHVPEGVSLVQRAGIGERIADFVREHHGTSLARFFYVRAHEQDPSVDPRAFQYPGPKPRSRETAILMIADQVEATARAMDGPTESDLRSMIEATLDRIHGEHQLDDCPLTVQEISAIREAFVQVLTGVHHRRIKYPRGDSNPTVSPS
jgi:putative nucleotidyltransferase with HDIG domain